MKRKKRLRNSAPMVSHIWMICLGVYLLAFGIYVLILGYFWGIVYSREYFIPFFACGILMVVALIIYGYVEGKKRREEIEKQNQLLREQYDMLREMYHGNAKLYHDFHNHVNVIYYLLEEDEFEEAKTYMEKISEPVQQISLLSRTGNDVVDIVLNSKRKIMEQNGIIFKMKVEFPAGMQIDPHDICIILTNLLDNATESCMKSAKARGSLTPPEVKLVIRRIQGFFFIKVMNTCEETTGNIFFSTKKNTGLHGYGLQNVRNVVEKYNGTMETGREKGQFNTVIMIPIQV